MMFWETRLGIPESHLEEDGNQYKMFSLENVNNQV